MSKVKKAIIPAAGLGTRFLPATKAMPKEMLPILNKPTIQYIIEEAVAAGIEDILIVTGARKRAIEDHFDHAFELESHLANQDKLGLLEQVQHPSNIADIHYIRQKEPRGLGHAIWCARKFIGDEPFAVLLGDDIVVSDVPCIEQLIQQYEETESPIVAVQEVPSEETHRYGIIDPAGRTDDLHRVSRFVEKPPQGEAPSNLAIMGRYVLTPDIFQLLEQQEVGAGGEIQLTDAIQKLNETRPVYGYAFSGKRYDVGDLIGFIMTTVEFALNDNELRGPVIEGLKSMLESTARV